MTHVELVTYITEQTQQGVSADVLRGTLIAAGWREVDIDNALHDIAAGLAPVTAGASIHEDLAQVRGMVAHLASRVRTLEKLLPSGTIGPERELSPPHRAVWLRHITTLLLATGLFVALLQYRGTLVDRTGLAPIDQATVAGATGLLLLIFGYVAMRLRWAWLASLITDSAVAVLAFTGWVAYHTYHAMEWSTALGLAILLAVLFVVMEKWIDRLAR